jgi:hypothetical protein
MAHVNSTLASVFIDKSDSDSWSKLKNHHRLSKLRSKFWGEKIEDEAKEWRNLQPTVKDDPTNDIGPGSYGLDLGIASLRVQSYGSGKIIFGFTTSAASGMKRICRLRQRRRTLSSLPVNRESVCSFPQWSPVLSLIAPCVKS